MALPAARTTRTCCGRRAAATTTATGCRSARDTPQRRARHRVLGPRRALMAEIARRARQAASARRTTERLRAGIRRRLQPRRTSATTASIEGDTQTVYLLALHMRPAARDALRPRAAERLVANIERHDWHLTTGFVGVGLLCPVLTEAGRADVAHRLLLNETLPVLGLLDPPRRHDDLGALGRLDASTPASRPPSMNSFNHYSLGSVGAVALRVRRRHPLRPARPATQHVLVAPEPGELECARATYRVRARADHERLAPDRRRAPARRRDPGQRHRHGRAPGRPGCSPRAAGTPRTPRACTRSAGRLPRSRRRSARGATRSRSRVTRPAAPPIRGREFRHLRPLDTRTPAIVQWRKPSGIGQPSRTETNRSGPPDARRDATEVHRRGAEDLRSRDDRRAGVAVRRVADDGPARSGRAGAPRRPPTYPRRRDPSHGLRARGLLRAPSEAPGRGQATPGRAGRRRDVGAGSGVPRLLDHELLRGAADGRDAHGGDRAHEQPARDGAGLPRGQRGPRSRVRRRHAPAPHPLVRRPLRRADGPRALRRPADPERQGAHGQRRDDRRRPPRGRGQADDDRPERRVGDAGGRLQAVDPRAERDRRRLRGHHGARRRPLGRAGRRLAGLGRVASSSCGRATTAARTRAPTPSPDRSPQTSTS